MFLHPNDRAMETDNPARAPAEGDTRMMGMCNLPALHAALFCTRMIEWWKLAALHALLKVVFSESKCAPIFCGLFMPLRASRSHSVPSGCAPDSEFAPGGAGRACTCFPTPFSQCRGGGSPMAALLPLAFSLDQLPLSRETGTPAARHLSGVLGYGVKPHVKAPPGAAPWLRIAFRKGENHAYAKIPLRLSARRDEQSPGVP